jgi:hypothetical protein
MPEEKERLMQSNRNTCSAHRMLKFLRTCSVIIGTCLLLACASQELQTPSDSSRSVFSEQEEHYTVALLGATGMAGGYLLRDALQRGHSVRALARTPAKLAEFSDQITIIQGDARNPQVIQELLSGSDVVINAVGPVKADGDSALFINSTVTRNILQEMKETEISQYMIVSGAAVVMPDDDRNILGWWVRTLARIGLNSALQDKQAEYEALAQSSANWMLVRCPLIDAEPYQSPPLVSLETPPAFRVRAGELARFMIDQIGQREYIRQGPFLGSH